MQFKSALRTFLATSLQNRPALRTPRNSPCSRHIHRSRSKREIFSRRGWSTRRRPLARALSLVIAIAILISVLTVFRHDASPSSTAILSPNSPGGKYTAVPAAFPLSIAERDAKKCNSEHHRHPEDRAFCGLQDLCISFTTHATEQKTDMARVSFVNLRALRGSGRCLPGNEPAPYKMNG